VHNFRHNFYVKQKQTLNKPNKQKKKKKKMASSFVSQSASFVLFVDNVRVGTLENRVPISLQIPSVAVPVAVLPIISDNGGFLTLEVAKTTSNQDEV
jgi:hypothetical protein